MKKLSLIRSELTNWFLSDKQMMLAVSLIYSSVYVIKPLRETAAFFNEPLNCFECFLTLLGNGFSMMVIVLARGLYRAQPQRERRDHPEAG